MKQLCLSFLIIFSLFQLHAQETYAEKLGYPKGAKVVILHIDDVGMSYDSNEGTIRALEKGISNSVSLMMPCPWIPDFMHYLKEHPSVDAGIHLTLTSEWKRYRWFPLSGRDVVKGLIDKEGAFPHSVEEVVKSATPDEVETEIRSQIARFRLFGLEPTHLDSHMGTLFAKPEFLMKYIQVGISEKIPVMFPGGHATLIAEINKSTDEQKAQFKQLGQMLWNAKLPVLDDLFPDTYGWKLDKSTPPTDDNLRKNTTAKYKKLFKDIKPGVTMIIMHCANPSPIYKYISADGGIRKGDMLAMLNPELKAMIKKEGLILTTWRELRDRRLALP